MAQSKKSSSEQAAKRAESRQRKRRAARRMRVSGKGVFALNRLVGRGSKKS